MHPWNGFMKAKVAVVTVSGKEYFLIICELKKENLPFLSLVPGQIVPAEARVVITTESERGLIDHERVLVFGSDSDIVEIVREAKRIVEGKEASEFIVIGIDPGRVLGVAVVADGRVVETADCFSIEETVEKVKRAIKGVNFCQTKVKVKVGDGFPECRDEFLGALDHSLPLEVLLEVVGEAGTNRFTKKHRRGLRDIVSATRIAGRHGYLVPRGQFSLANCE
jgi:hypothetical protein